jgi:hypothetical protein
MPIVFNCPCGKKFNTRGDYAGISERRTKSTVEQVLEWVSSSVGARLQTYARDKNSVSTQNSRSGPTISGQECLPRGSRVV